MTRNVCSVKRVHVHRWLARILTTNLNFFTRDDRVKWVVNQRHFSRRREPKRNNEGVVSLNSLGVTMMLGTS